MNKVKFHHNHKYDNLIIFMFILFFVLVTTVFFWPLIKEVSTVDFTNNLADFINKFGYFGWIILLAAQMIQVIIAVLPGGPFEIIAGMVYGPWLGTIILTIGGILASSVIFKLCKKYGRPFILKFFKEKHIKEWSWLEDNNKLDVITFITYLIPGTPKDMLTYLLGTSKMSLKRFLLISNLGRIPALFVSCALGSSITEGDYQKLWIFTFVLILFVIFSFLFREQIFDFYKKKKSKLSQ